jgi:hypothetical protein
MQSQEILQSDQLSHMPAPSSPAYYGLASVFWTLVVVVLRLHGKLKQQICDVNKMQGCKAIHKFSV